MRKLMVVLGITMLGGCGGSRPGVCSRDGGAACFEVPTEVMRAYEQGGSSDVPVLGCGEIVPTQSTTEVALSGQVIDYSSNEPLAGVTLELFNDGNYQNAIATATTDNSGSYSMNLPSGTPDLLWGAISGGGVVPQLRDQLRPGLEQTALEVDFTTATPELLNAVAANVAVDRDGELAELVVQVRDCDRRSLMHVALVLSATAGERDFVDGVPVFYSVVGEFPLPAASTHETIRDGSAVVLNVPVDGGELYIQAWGFANTADVALGEDGLVLVAERGVARRAGATTWVNLWANQN